MAGLWSVWVACEGERGEGYRKSKCRRVERQFQVPDCSTVIIVAVQMLLPLPPTYGVVGRLDE